MSSISEGAKENVKRYIQLAYEALLESPVAAKTDLGKYATIEVAKMIQKEYSDLINR